MTDIEKAECEGVIRLLTAKLEEAVGEIDRLRAVVAKLTEGTDDAHSTLRRLYLDEALSPTTRVRAAQAALNVEKASLKPTEAPLDLIAEPIEPLAEVVRRQRARADKMLSEPPYRQPDSHQVILLKPNGNANGNGDDHS